MRVKLLCIFIVILMVIVLLGGLFISFRNKEIFVSAFSITEYTEIINQFSANLHTEPVATPKQAIETAEQIWVAIYGESVKQNQPYAVSYDKDCCVWLVRGCLPHNSIGGVPYLIIHENGQVIAVWHSK